MTAKIALVDMDNVLAGWTDGIIEGLLRAGYSPEVLDLTRWDLGMDESTRRIVRRTQATPGFYRNLRPIEGGAEGLAELERLGYEVFICSTPDATNVTCASDKLEWVREHLGEAWVKRVILTHPKSLVRGAVLIDDKPVIDDIDEAEWVRVVFDQPYNQDTEGPRLHGWGDLSVIEEVLA